MKPVSIIRNILFATLDCVFCLLSWLAALVVFTYFFKNDYPVTAMIIIQNFPVMAAFCVLSNTVCGVYRSLWRHIGIGGVIRLTFSVLIISLAFFVYLRLRMGFWINPGIGMMSFYFFLTSELLTRIYKTIIQSLSGHIRRVFNINTDGGQEPVRTLLIGAGKAAESFLRNSALHGGRPRLNLGVVDIDPRKHGYRLHGVPIYGGDENIPALIKRLDIAEIIVTVSSISNDKLREIVSMSVVNRCKVRLLSALSDDKAGDVMRDIDIGDLLGRPEAVLDMKEIGRWLNGKTVLVTGGGGSIGGELCRQLLAFDAGKVIIYDISENNAYNLKEELIVSLGQEGKYKVVVRIGSIQDEERLNDVFNEYKPSIVFHAAAYKHVPLMEECPRLALENNALGTYKTALCACRHNVQKFIMISTDKTIKPTNVMGATKRVAELIVLGLNKQSETEFACVRFGNVLDSNGSVIPLFKRQIQSGGPVTVTHPDIIRYFMTIPEAAKLVLEAGAMAQGGEIFILDMGKPVKITELAENLIRLAGLTPNVDIKIEFCGLRPGEKLYEELLLEHESIIGTLNEKIFVIKSEPVTEYSKLADFMETEITSLKDDNVRDWLKTVVPEYQYVNQSTTPKQAVSV